MACAAGRAGLALARSAIDSRLQLQRTLGSSKAFRALSAACQLPHQRGEAPATPARALGTARAAPQAAAVEAAPSAASHDSNGGSAAAAAVAAGAPTFQEAIARLQEYWASVGCALWLPHNTEVSTGECGARGGAPLRPQRQ